MADVHTLDDIEIPRGLVWSDEFRWVGRQATTERSLTGALLLDVGMRIAGRPITLEAADDAGWMPRATLEALQALCDADPTAVHHLVLADGREFDVVFADGDAAPVSGEPVPVARPELPPASFPYVAIVRLITV